MIQKLPFVPEGSQSALLGQMVTVLLSLTQRKHMPATPKEVWVEPGRPLACPGGSGQQTDACTLSSRGHPGMMETKSDSHV